MDDLFSSISIDIKNYLLIIISLWNILKFHKRLYIAFQVFSTLVFISAHPTFLGFYEMCSSRVLDTLEATIQLET